MTSSMLSRTSSPRAFLAAAIAAPLGLPLVNPFHRGGTVYTATLELDAGAKLPAGASLLRPGAKHQALVRTGVLPLSTGDEVPTLTVRIVDAYGSGRHQDFLLASSLDGAPGHHLLAPATRPGERLFSSLWLYLAGRTPLLFGVLPFDGQIESGAVLPFAVSGPVGRFRRVGALTLGDSVDEAGTDALSIAAVNDGGGLRALPPTRLYRETD
jgi:hypothetical protein